ncbi:hypothetical protein C8Q78DRAFT_468888 [Trametes maxima]|nr:hypothetical protein C8Q78DRAFT_468888 [Trametes maxima]
MARRDRVPRPPAAVPAGAYAQPQIWTLTSTFHLRSATPCPVAEVAASSPPALPIVFLGVCHHLVCSNSPVRRARGNCAATTLFVSNGQCTSKTAPVCRKSSPAPGVTKHNNFVAPWHHTRSLRPPTPKGPSTESGGSGIDTSNDGPSGHRQRSAWLPAPCNLI